MKNGLSLKNIFLRFKWKIIVTFLLLVLENAFTVLLPFVMGLAINDLLDKSINGLLYFAAVYLGHLLTGTLRRIYDTRAYTSIYTIIASETVHHHRQNQVSNSKTITRASLVRELEKRGADYEIIDD